MGEVKKFISSARDLDVYKAAYSLALEMHKASADFPKEEQFALTNQLRRASKSICANLSEGFVKQSHSKKEFARFISMAIGSAAEMETWIHFAYDLGYINQQTMSRWFSENQKVLSMLIKLRDKLDA